MLFRLQEARSDTDVLLPPPGFVIVTLDTAAPEFGSARTSTRAFAALVYST